jgi:hypothetical protein
VDGGEIGPRRDHRRHPPASAAARTLFTGVGGDELSGMMTDAHHLVGMLAPLARTALSRQVQEFPGEEHITLLPSLGRSGRPWLQ